MKNSQEIIFVEAGEKIEIFNRRFSSVPMSYEFSAKPVGSKPLSGSLEIHSKKTVFTRPVKTIDLKSTNAVNASLWDTFMTIYVLAGCDMEISIPKKKMSSSKALISMIVLVVILALVLILPGLNST